MNCAHLERYIQWRCVRLRATSLLRFVAVECCAHCGELGTLRERPPDKETPTGQGGREVKQIAAEPKPAPIVAPRQTPFPRKFTLILGGKA